MQEIINSKLFIPAMILLGAAIISIIILVIVSKKNKKKVTNINEDLKLDKKVSLGEGNNEIENNIIKEAIVPTVPVEDTKVSVLPVVPMADVKENTVPTTPTVESVLPTVEIVKEEPKEEPVNEVKVVESVPKKESVPMGPPPTIDIPIPTVDDTPITVDEVKSLVGEDLKDSIEVEKYEAVEEPVNQAEIINVTEAVPLVENNEETITVEEVNSLTNEVGEQINVEEIKPITSDVGETAFKSIPSGNTNINTDIKVDPIEPVSNKTEIFNLDDIQKELQKNEENKRELL